MGGVELENLLLESLDLGFLVVDLCLVSVFAFVDLLADLLVLDVFEIGLALHVLSCGL